MRFPKERYHSCMKKFEQQGGAEASGRKAQLLAEIASLNQMTHRTREEDGELASRINAEPGFAPLATETLENNNQAVINQRQEIAQRAQELGISLEEALKIGVDEPMS